MSLLGGLSLTTTDFQAVNILPNRRGENCKIVVCNTGLEDDYLYLSIQEEGKEILGTLVLFNKFPILAGDTYTSSFELSLSNVIQMQAKSFRGLLSITILN